MKRAFVQLTLFFLLFAVVMILRFPYHDYGLGIFDSLRSSLRAQGILLEAEDIQFSFPAKVEFDNLSLLLPHQRLPIPIHAERAMLDPSLSSLFLLRGVLHSDVQAYKGTIQSKVDYSLWGEHAAFELLAENLQLGEHPLMKANGVSGTLRLQASGELENTRVKAGSPATPVLEASSLKLLLENAQYSGNFKIQGFIPVPNLSDVRSELVAHHNENVTNIKLFNLFSSLGQLEAKGRIEGSQRIEKLDISGTISLTADGEKQIAGYLALSAGLPPDSAARDWSFTLIQNAPSELPIFKAKPL